MAASSEFQPLNIAVLTVSDTRSEENDTSGQQLIESLTQAGHQLAERKIVKDDIYQIRAILSQWIADKGIQVILTTGGTGFTPTQNMLDEDFRFRSRDQRPAIGFEGQRHELRFASNVLQRLTGAPPRHKRLKLLG